MNGESLHITRQPGIEMLVMGYTRGDDLQMVAILDALASIAASGSIRQVAMRHGLHARTLGRWVREVQELGAKVAGKA